MTPTPAGEVERLLADLRRDLRALGHLRRRRVLAEMHDHLLSAIEEGLALGKSEHEAARSAVAHFGDPRLVARLFRDARPSRRRRALPLLACVAAVLGLAALPASPIGELAPHSAVAAAPCDQTSATRAVDAFISAFNQGNQQSLRAAIAPAKDFGWYSVPGPNGRFSMQDASNRATLFSYFRVRHRHDERMKETRLQFNGIERGKGKGDGTFGGFTFTIVRQAADVPSTWVSGKGAVLCSAPNRIAVWSQALTVLPGMGPLDPIAFPPSVVRLERDVAGNRGRAKHADQSLPTAHLRLGLPARWWLT